MIKGISIEGVYRFLKKYYRWIVWIIFFLLIAANILIFYQYVYLTTKAEASLVGRETSINQERLQEVLDNIGDREENLSRVLRKDYPDLFSP